MACVPPINRPIGNVCTCSGWGTNNDGTCNTATTIVGQNLFNYWCLNDCPTAYATQLNDTNGVLSFNPQNLPVVQGELSNLFKTYQVTNSITSNTQSSAYSPFQDELLNVCADPRLPGACDTALETFCNGFTRDQIEVNEVLTNFCGCYAPPDPVYAQLPPGSGYTPPCDPLCSRASTVQKATNGVFDLCDNNVCTISNVNVNLSQSSIGAISFSNVCPACPNSEGATVCTCVISGDNINQTLSNLGVGTQFNQLCGPGSLCNLNGVWGPCPDVNSESTLGDFFPWKVLLFLFLAFIFIILVLLAIKYAGSTVVLPGILVDTGPMKAGTAQYSYQLHKSAS